MNNPELNHRLSQTYIEHYQQRISYNQHLLDSIPPPPTEWKAHLLLEIELFKLSIEGLQHTPPPPPTPWWRFCCRSHLT